MKTNQSSIQETALSFTLCALIALAACSKPGSKDAGHNADASLQGTLLLTGSLHLRVLLVKLIYKTWPVATESIAFM